jgi:hypothetical protein
MTRQSRKRYRFWIDHVLIGLVIVFGTSAVSAMSELDRWKPGATLLERVMLLFPCGSP